MKSPFMIEGPQASKAPGIPSGTVPASPDMTRPPGKHPSDTPPHVPTGGPQQSTHADIDLQPPGPFPSSRGLGNAPRTLPARTPPPDVAEPRRADSSNPGQVLPDEPQSTEHDQGTDQSRRRTVPSTTGRRISVPAQRTRDTAPDTIIESEENRTSVRGGTRVDPPLDHGTKTHRETTEIDLTEVDERNIKIPDRESEVEIPPFGSWKSPISAEMLSSHTIGLESAELVDGQAYWTESRPMDNGRVVLVKRLANGGKEDITTKDYNVRTEANDYGGKAYVINGDEIYFSNFDDGRIYKQIGQEVIPITPEGEYRYADFIIDKNEKRNRLICVREDHTQDGDPQNTLVAIDLGGKNKTEILASGDDFYTSPSISPDGSQIAWLSWKHPNLPFTGTTLTLGEFDEKGKIANEHVVAGGDAESIFQPSWSPSGQLYFVSDRNKNGFWNIYRLNEDKSIEPIHETNAEYGLPQWEFGMSTYGFISDNEIVAAVNNQGVWELEKINTDTKEVSPIHLQFTQISNLTADKGSVTFIGASPTELSAPVTLSIADQHLEVISKSTESSIDPDYISVAKAIQYKTSDGEDAYGFYYEPKNKDFIAPDDELPPLLVMCHGGPTDAASNALNLDIQFWTSRGFAVLDVNYRGSTGFGRAYREKLNGQWGIADVEDCVNGAKFLIEQGKVDKNRMAIRGESAGGFTTLAALAFTKVFAVGSSYYGISDLVRLVGFPGITEHYLDLLVGPYQTDLDKEEYARRSPINHLDGFKSPVIFLQGANDPVVRPEQSEKIHDALKQRGIKTVYIEFPEEQHGFRKEGTIKESLQEELKFFGEVLGFTPAEDSPRAA